MNTHKQHIGAVKVEAGFDIIGEHHEQEVRTYHL
jgi:hypothetical protein